MNRMERPFNEILDECLDRVLTHGQSIDACVAEYPAHAVELRDELQFALELRQAFAFQPDMDRKRSARQRYLSAVDRRYRSGAARLLTPVRALLVNGRRWGITAAALLIMAMFGGTTTVMAAESSMPGDPLYPVKRVTENTRLALASSQQRQADLHTAYLERRTEELEMVTKQGKAERAPALIQEMERHAEKSREIAAGPVNQVVTGARQETASKLATTPTATRVQQVATVQSRKTVAPTPTPVITKVSAERLLQYKQQLEEMDERLQRLAAQVKDSRTLALVHEAQEALRSNQSATDRLIAEMVSLQVKESTPVEVPSLLPTNKATTQQGEATPAPLANPLLTAHVVTGRLKDLSVIREKGKGITQVDVTVETAPGQTTIVHVLRNKTRFLKDGKPAELDDLRHGAQVTILVQPSTGDAWSIDVESKSKSKGKGSDKETNDRDDHQDDDDDDDD